MLQREVILLLFFSNRNNFVEIICKMEYAAVFVSRKVVPVLLDFKSSLRDTKGRQKYGKLKILDNVTYLV